jgi:hypothetical protein
VGGRHDLRKSGRLFTGTERSKGPQKLEPRPERQAKLPQVLIGEITKYVGIDRIVAKRLGVVLQTDTAEPTVDVQVQSPGLLSAADFEKG